MDNRKECVYALTQLRTNNDYLRRTIQTNPQNH
jgi:hypothetical protein